MDWEEEGEEEYPDAACKPSPREPPVTMATFPLREKMEGKSLRVAWAFASAAMLICRGCGQWDGERICWR